MSYQVLARKWRPKTFAELVGQEHVVTALTNALTSKRLHHAYLLTGTRGVGKTTIARLLAKSLNCITNGVTATPCGTCAACVDIDAGRFVDLLELDAASNTGVDNMREILDNARYAPTVGRYKVYLIDEVHMLSKSAFNSMLKTLEEPPEHVKFVLATTDPQKIPVTVLSRCLQFNLKQLPQAQIAERLLFILEAEKIAADRDAIALIARAAAGSMRDALSLLDQAIAHGNGQVREGRRAGDAGRGRQGIHLPDRRRRRCRRRQRAPRRDRRDHRAKHRLRGRAGRARLALPSHRGRADGAGGGERHSTTPSASRRLRPASRRRTCSSPTRFAFRAAPTFRWPRMSPPDSRWRSCGCSRSSPAAQREASRAIGSRRRRRSRGRPRKVAPPRWRRPPPRR